MKPKEIKAVLEANPGRQLYLRQGDSSCLVLHRLTSKTELTRNAKLFHSYTVSTYGEARPDLKGKIGPEGYENTPIITFDATIASGKTLREKLDEITAQQRQKG